MTKVFISYAHEDLAIAKKIYSDLKSANLNVWIDDEDLLPGQNWRFAIKEAIVDSTYFLALFSTNSINKRGFFQKEVRIAIDILDEIPEGRIFFIPVRIEECIPSQQKISDLHWVDLFTSYEYNFKKLLRALNYQKDERNNEIVQAIKLKDDEEVFTFQFRAECEHDVNELYKIISPHVKQLRKTNAILDLRTLARTEELKSMMSFVPIPDMDVEVETTLSLKELRNAMLQVEDGHVMVETVAPISEYTGERIYGEYSVEND